MLSLASNSNSERSQSGSDAVESDPHQGEQWSVYKVFQNKQEFDDFRKTEHWWSIAKSQKLVSGTKTKYRCNYVKANGPQCAAEIYCMENNVVSDESIDSDGDNRDPQNAVTFTVFRKNANHTHEQLVNNLTSKVFPDIEEKIIEQHIQNKKPRAIGFALRADKSIPKERQPTKRQIKNVVAKYKAAQGEKEPLTMKKLTEIVNKYTNIPNDQDEAYIVGFDRSPRTQQDEKYFRIFISTRRLLQNTANANTAHSDATHKVTAEKTPLIIVGSSDLDGNFHPIGLMI